MPALPEWLWTALLWLASAAVAGVIGNALWDLLKQRLFGWLVTAFAVLTFNTQAARDEVFAVAAQQDSRSKNAVVVFVTVLTPLLGLALLVRILARDPSNPGRTLASLLNPELSAALAFGAVALAMLVFYVLLRNLLLLSQASALTDRFERLLLIAGPGLDNPQRDLLRRKFSLMTTEKDYLEIATILRDEGARTGFHIPEYLLPPPLRRDQSTNR